MRRDANYSIWQVLVFTLLCADTTMDGQQHDLNCRLLMAIGSCAVSAFTTTAAQYMMRLVGCVIRLS